MADVTQKKIVRAKVTHFKGGALISTDHRKFVTFPQKKIDPSVVAELHNAQISSRAFERRRSAAQPGNVAACSGSCEMCDIEVGCCRNWVVDYGIELRG